MVKQAEESEIPVIEEILLDAVRWMSVSGINNQWTEANVKWDCLSKEYNVGEFYISYQKGVPSACMALTEYDPKHWPNLSRGSSLYLHKLAVKRAFSGQGISEELIQFSKKMAKDLGKNTIRLNCNQHRKKLRALYEKEGFICVEEKAVSPSYDIALYVWQSSC